MKKLIRIIFASIAIIIYSSKCIGQTIKNFGDAQIHNSAELGVFSSFENDGMLLGESGLLGFYGSNSLLLSGTQIPTVFDVEIANENGLYLDLPFEVSNTMNFIYGNVLTNRNQPNNFLELKVNASYLGESNFSKTDGFIQTTVNESYLFPIGDESSLRPLAVSEVPVNTNLKSAYFYSNPIDLFSDLENLGPKISKVSRTEFWKLSGEASLKVTLGWNDRSSIFELTSEIQNLTIVGYHKENKNWVDIGSIDITGNITEGFITSEQIIPKQYEAFTIGLKKGKQQRIFQKHHYLITPNGDGVNDFLYIPELENYGNNRVEIFNRFGVKVFEIENYKNEFNGTYTISKPSINKENGLPSGVYFYMVFIPDEELSYQGFLYLNQ